MGMNCLTKSLIGGTSLAGILAITFIILYAVNDGENVGPSEDQESIEAAARILSTMDQTADPCNDFWQYACGGWLEKNVIPSSMGRLASFDACDDNVAVVLKKELENVEEKSSSTSVEKAKKFYLSCMDNQARNSEAEKSMTDFVKNTLKGWPMAYDSFDVSKDFELESTLYNFAYNANTRPVINIVTAVDSYHAKNHLIAVDQPGLVLGSTLNYEFHKEEASANEKAKIDQLKEAYVLYLTEVARLYCSSLYTTCDEPTIKKAAEAVYDLENDIAAIMVSASDRSSNDALTFNNKTIGTFESEYGTVGTLVKDLLMDLYDGVQPALDDDTYINDASEAYFAKLGSVVASADPTVVQNMLVFRAVHPLIGSLPDAYMTAEDILRFARYGTTSRTDRYKTCIDMTNNAMTFPVGSLYVEKAFAEESKDKISDMIGLVEQIFKGPILDDATWMDDPTKSKAEIKADKVMDFIGYPPYIVNDKPKMDRDYDDLEVNEKDLFANVLNAGVRAYRLDLEILPEDTDRARWSTGPAIVNAWYSPTRNTITFPAGILQSPFYDAGAPSSINYGAIGTVIGHELTHGFDDSGRNYDGDGNKNNWWSKSSAEGFKERTTCMANQYSGFYWDEAQLNVDGQSTLGENIADNGGIRESFFAYQDWRAENRKDVRLPGLESFSDEQLFFLGFSQVWCALYTPEEAANRVKTDVHSPNRFRVQGPLSNFEEFGKAYGCTQGKDLYYPNKEDTCQVW